MHEPIDPIVPVPRPGGWPRAVYRMELLGALAPEQAYYELACVSRQLRLGVVAEYQGLDLYAFPHQSTSEIARSHQAAKAFLAARSPADQREAAAVSLRVLIRQRATRLALGGAV